MKRLFIFIALMTLPAMALAQANRVGPIGGSATQDVYAITNWSAFTTDSVGTFSTTLFNLAGYDSVDVWASGISTNGSAKFTGILQGTFLTSPASTDLISLGTAADTTNIKLETIYYVGRLGTKGALLGRLKVTGVAAGDNINRKDTKVTFYVIGRRGGYTGNR